MRGKEQSILLFSQHSKPLEPERFQGFFFIKHHNYLLPNCPSEPRRFCGVAFSLKAKTLAEGRLRRPEHSNAEGCRPPSGGRNPKQKATAFAVAFCFGKALQSRYFKFSICHLEILPNGPSGPRRFCGVRAFCRRQNLGGGMALPSRAFESPKGGAGPRPAKPKKKDTL